MSQNGGAGAAGQERSRSPGDNPGKKGHVSITQRSNDRVFGHAAGHSLGVPDAGISHGLGRIAGTPG